MISMKNQKRFSNLSLDSNKISNFNNSALDIISKNDEIEERYRTNRNKLIEENCNNLYMTSYKKKEKKEQITKEFNQIKDKIEIQDCSFKPTFISPKKPVEGDLLKLGFFERRDQMKEKIKEKYL